MISRIIAKLSRNSICDNFHFRCRFCWFFHKSPDGDDDIDFGDEVDDGLDGGMLCFSRGLEGNGNDDDDDRTIISLARVLLDFPVRRRRGLVMANWP